MYYIVMHFPRGPGVIPRDDYLSNDGEARRGR
jgi:hypothetical protein